MNEIIETTQTLLQQGKTGQALTLLIGFLEKDRRYAGFVHTLRVVEANYNRTREQELKDLITPQDTQRVYNQTSDTVLNVLEALALGKTAFAAPEVSKRNWLPLILGSGLGGVVLAAAVWFFIGRERGPQCPDFKADVPKVLILPFINITGDEKSAKADVLIRDRIEAISARNNFPLSVGILKNYDAATEKPGKAEAENLLQRCNANMVIWGTYLEESGGQPKVDTRFVIENKAGGSTGFQAFSALGDLGNAQNQEFRSIDDAVFSLCSWMAFAMQQDSTAAKWQNKVQQKNKDDRDLLAKMR